jgi:two-component system LytT family response regulator
MKALIIEDEELAASRLMKLLKEMQPDIELAGPLDSVSAAVAHLQNNNGYDLLFLDIQLADGKSFSIFEKVQVNIPIIFTTAYDEYAIKAFELNSIDYLLKPINKEKLQQALEKYRNVSSFYSKDNSVGPNHELFEWLKTMQGGKPQLYKTRFLVSRGDTLLPITTKEIAYFFAEEKSVLMMTLDKKQHLVNFTLEELERKLDPAQFFRVNRQFLVSINAIHKVHNYFHYKLKLELIPDPGEEVVVSKTRTSEFRDWMNDE